MGTEYYIIKPRTKEMFYLGKDLWFQMEDLPIVEPQFTNYEYYTDVLVDMVRGYCFSPDDTMEYMCLLAHEIFDFVESEEVQLVSDIDEDTSWLNEYKEVKDITEIARRIYGG